MNFREFLPLGYAHLYFRHTFLTPSIVQIDLMRVYDFLNPSACIPYLYF